jgi:hypothetical protein
VNERGEECFDGCVGAGDRGWRSLGAVLNGGGSSSSGLSLQEGVPSGVWAGWTAVGASTPSDCRRNGLRSESLCLPEIDPDFGVSPTSRFEASLKIIETGDLPIEKFIQNPGQRRSPNPNSFDVGRIMGHLI